MDPGAPVPDEFLAELEREELRRARTGEELAVAVLDIDGFSAINASGGRDAGDALLAACADALHDTLRATDMVARTGADEFSILLHATDTVRADRWAARFDAVFAADTASAGGGATASLGIGCTIEAPSLMEAHARARQRMEAIQQVRKLLRRSGSG